MSIDAISSSAPFHAGTFEGVHYFHLTVDDRLRAVKNFDAAKCRETLKVPSLQKTVRTAIERRPRKLEKRGR